MPQATTDINRIIDWLEQLSNQDGYAEARQFRRDVIAVMGTSGVSWDGLSEQTIAAALRVWLDRTRAGGVNLPMLPGEAVGPASGLIKRALEAHETGTNRPSTLSVEQFGDALQALWTSLRGAESDASDDPAPETAQPNGALRANFNLKP